MRIRTLLAALTSAAIAVACSAPTAPRAPATLAPQVDLKRFMGDWYVIASIPTFLEKGAHNAIERYRLDEDGSIAVNFSFNAGAFDGPLKTYAPRGFVLDSSNARWGMRFVWPIKADYRISYLTNDYSLTVIGREARDHVWIMARTPSLPEADYQRMVEFVTREGYDVGKLERVPQSPRFQPCCTSAFGPAGRAR
jgi:apolipoprotein D and lipocalin family protein